MERDEDLGKDFMAVKLIEISPRKIGIGRALRNWNRRRCIMRKNFKCDILSGIIFLIFSIIFVLLTPEQIKTTETGFFTARTFPYITLGIIMVCSIILIASGVIKTIISKGKEDNDEKVKGRTEKNIESKVLGVFLLVTGAVVIGGVVNLLVSGLFLTVGFLLMYRDKKMIHYIVVIVLVAAFYYLFEFGFGLKLP
ncbi:MAG: tripartite tricarboxylate transporter TctB family protein [Lachnospiraceae bacterium]|nr:tripartite tricarboxylate transporter TctB family protein [Lachnospiraceae bacterium]